jgi:hypothetical protein
VYNKSTSLGERPNRVNTSSDALPCNRWPYASQYAVHEGEFVAGQYLALNVFVHDKLSFIKDSNAITHDLQ